MTASITFTPPITSTDDALYALLKGAPAPAPGPTPVPPDTNIYPLPMPANTPAGAAVSLGTGPDSILVSLANNPLNTGHCSVVILIDGKPIAGPLDVSDNGGQGGGQMFTIHGSWGPLPHIIGVSLLNAQVGALWTNGVWYNLVQLACGTSSTLATFQNADYTNNWQQITAGPNPSPTPGPTAASQITAIVDGTAKTDTLQNLVNAAATSVVLPAGTFAGVASIPKAITLSGAGSGKTTIDARGLALARGGKGVLVPLVKGVVFQGLSIHGDFTVPASGGIREDADGCDWTATDIEIYGCTDGIGPSFASNITVTGASIHGNGAPDGHSHNAYFNGSPGTTVTLNNYVSTASVGGHEVKCRAGTLLINGGVLTTGGNGRCIDQPDCGNVTCTGVTFALPSGAPDFEMIGYGMESANNPVGTVTLTNCTFNTPTGMTAKLQVGAFGTGAKLVINNATYIGNKPTFAGWASVTETGGPTPVPPSTPFPDKTNIAMGTDFTDIPSMLAYFNTMAAIPISATKPVWTHPVTVGFPAGEMAWNSAIGAPGKLGITQDAGGYPLGTTAANNLTITALAGKGFRDNPNIRTTPLAYNPANGAAIKGVNSPAFNIIHMDKDFVNVRGLQFGSQFSGDQSSLSFVIEDCIILGGIWIISGVYTLRNCLILGDVTTSYGGTFVNCTILGQLFMQFNAPGFLVRNCLIYTQGRPLLNPSSSTQIIFDHCQTDVATPPAGCTTVPLAGQFMGASDYRLAAGAAAIGAGVADPVNAAVDISGKARIGAVDIGCWQI